MENLYDQTENQVEDLVEIKTKLFLENSLESDLGLATTENKILLDRFKTHKNFWEHFLNLSITYTLRIAPNLRLVLMHI